MLPPQSSTSEPVHTLEPYGVEGAPVLSNATHESDVVEYRAPLTVGRKKLPAATPDKIISLPVHTAVGLLEIEVPTGTPDVEGLSQRSEMGE